MRQATQKKTLTKHQIHLLLILFKFRFITIPILSQWLKKDPSTLYERLALLTEKGYVHKIYKERWRLYGKPAIYTLSSKAIGVVRRELKQKPLTERSYRNQYRNATLSFQAMNQYVNLAAILVTLANQYLGILEPRTRIEIDEEGNTTRNTPYAMLEITRPDQPEVWYRLDVIEPGLPAWLLEKRIQSSTVWYDESNEGWSSEESGYPALLLLCENKRTEQRIHGYVDSYMYDFPILTTTKQRFYSGKKKIWLYDNEGEMVYREL